MTTYQIPITNMQCPNCGAAVILGDRFCEECGTPLAETVPYLDGCQKCGAPLEVIDTDGYCSNCGFRNLWISENDRPERIEIIVQSNLAGISDRGLRHHQNEDAVACVKIDGKNAYVLVVCDGVSSSQTPGLASKFAAEIACKNISKAVEKDAIKLEDAIKIAIGEAQLSVCNIPYINGVDVDPPSTTIVAAVVVDNKAIVGWLGDSRAYWISPQGSKQLTKDDSWLNDIVSSGKMTELEAIKFPQAHAITRWLGADIGENWQPAIANFDIPGSGYLLLCSDGLWNYAPDPSQIENMLKKNSHTDAAKVSRSLVEFARRQGGHDNITVALLSINLD
jgi:PPM family protein phosphatase